MNTLVRMSAEPTRTRVLITQGPTDIGKVILPLSSSPHPRAMVTLLEGLSLFLSEQLCVVLCVDESSSSCGSLGLLDALGYGERSPFYEVAVATRTSRTSRRGVGRCIRLVGGGDFRDLRWLLSSCVRRFSGADGISRRVVGGPVVCGRGLSRNVNNKPKHHSRRALLPESSPKSQPGTQNSTTSAE